MGHAVALCQPIRVADNYLVASGVSWRPGEHPPHNRLSKVFLRATPGSSSSEGSRRCTTYPLRQRSTDGCQSTKVDLAEAKGRRAWTRDGLAAMLAALAAAATGNSRHKRAHAEVSSSTASSSSTTQEERRSPRLKRLLSDPEVLELRELQDAVQLYDVRARKFVALPKLLKDGQPLKDADLICIGELHDSKEDHAVQRLLLDAVIYKLFLELRASENVDPESPRGRMPQNLSPQRVALGVEYFMWNQQGTLDDLIFGETSAWQSEKFRTAVRWDEVWSYDWALYEPLFRFCRLNLTRLVGLTVPVEASSIVAKLGVDEAPDWLKESLPAMDLSQKLHRRRFEDLFKVPMDRAWERMNEPLDGWEPNPKLDKIYAAQVLWDECMADRARLYLQENAGRMVLFAGINHVWRDAVPNRFERSAARNGKRMKAVTIIPWHAPELPTELPAGAKGADYYICSGGPGGGKVIEGALAAQRQRLSGVPRVFPAGYL